PAPRSWSYDRACNAPRSRGEASRLPRSWSGSSFLGRSWASAHAGTGGTIREHAYVEKSSGQYESRNADLSLANELCPQDETLYPLEFAIDLLRISSQPDRFNDCATLERLAGAL